MGKKGEKQYVRICKNHHAQFEGFRLPPGAIYGRRGNELFVSTHRKEKNGEVRVFVKRDSGDWINEKISVKDPIYQTILGCISKNGTPTLGKYNAPKKHKPDYSNFEKIEYQGEHYLAFPYEMPIQDYRVSRELASIVPNLAVPKKFDAKRNKQFTSAQYSVESWGKKYLFYNHGDAIEFCMKNGISETMIEQEFVSGDSVTEIGNECAYWEMGKDKNRNCQYSRKYKANV